MGLSWFVACPGRSARAALTTVAEAAGMVLPWNSRLRVWRGDGSAVPLGRIHKRKPGDNIDRRQM